MSVAAKLIQHGPQALPEGPYLVWENFGCEGWQPTSFPTLDEAVRRRRDGQCLITKIVQYEVIERDSQVIAKAATPPIESPT